MRPELHIEVEAYPVVSHAMAHNRISPVQRVTLHNDDVLRTGVEVHVSLRDGQGVLSEPSSLTPTSKRGARRRSVTRRSTSTLPP